MNLLDTSANFFFLALKIHFRTPDNAELHVARIPARPRPRGSTSCSAKR